MWQQIELSRQAVRAAPKVLDNAQSQLSTLHSIVQEVEREPGLHTPAIQSQLDTIRNVILELDEILRRLIDRQDQSAWRQNMRALHCREKDEANISRVLMQVERASLELVVRINVAHVSITRGMEQSIKTMISESRSERLQDRDSVTTLEGEQNDGADEQRHQQRPEGDRESGTLVIEDNSADDKAHQSNGIIGLDSSASARIVENTALGESKQRNIILGGPLPSQFLNTLFPYIQTR